jgi:hypothetical protein
MVCDGLAGLLPLLTGVCTQHHATSVAHKQTHNQVEADTRYALWCSCSDAQPTHSVWSRRCRPPNLLLAVLLAVQGKSATDVGHYQGRSCGDQMLLDHGTDKHALRSAAARVSWGGSASVTRMPQLVRRVRCKFGSHLVVLRWMGRQKAAVHLQGIQHLTD